MSFSLNDALTQYGVESGEIELETTNPAGEEEITVITDDTQSDLEEAVSDLADKVERLEEKDDAAEKVVEAVESLESFVGQIDALIEAGTPLTAQAAKFYVQGIAASLEARKIPAAIFGADLIGMNESFESNTLEDYATEAEEKGTGVLAKLVNMLRAAAASVKAAIIQFFQSIGKSAQAIKLAGEKLKRVGAGLKGEPKVKELSAGSYRMITVGGSVAPTAALEAIIKCYKSDVTQITGQIRKSMEPLITAMGNPTGAGIKAAGAALNASALADHKRPLPGGYEAVWKVGAGEGMDKLSGAKFGIKKGEGGGADKAPVLSPAEIVSLGAELIKVAAEMEAAKKDGDATIAANDKLVAAAGKVVGGAGRAVKDKVGLNKSETKSDDADARQVLKMAKAAMSANKNIVPEFVKYMGTAAKTAYAYGAASAGKYSSKEAKAPAEAPVKKDDE